MFKKETIGKLVFIFGIATFIESMIDLVTLLFPLRLGDSQWVYSIARVISETSIIPMLGILFIIAGFYLCNSGENKAIILFEKVAASVCALFAGFLILITFLFSISLSSVENDMVSKVKEQGENIKKQITAYSDKNQNVPIEEVAKSIKKVDENLVEKVNSISKSFLKANVKIFINMLSYIIAYVLFSLILLKSSIITRKKLYYKDNS